MYRHILFATDGSARSRRAVRSGLQLAKAVGARATLLHVVAAYAPRASAVASMRGFAAAVRREADRATRSARAEARAQGVPAAMVTVVGGEPWRSLLAAARSRRCDLIVMASHGRRGLAGLLLGSETSKVLSHSKIPVLVCR